MASDDKSKVTVDSILAKLSPEEKKVIEQAQRTVEARAKKKSVQRRLDDDDRKCIRECLKKAGCKDKKLALNDARTIALHWVLTEHSKEFGQYINGLLHGVVATSETEKVESPTVAQPRQNVQQGSYKRPVGQGNQ